MKILHILNDGPTKLSDQIISIQSREHEVRIIDLASVPVDYDNLVREIFFTDKVISW